MKYDKRTIKGIVYFRHRIYDPVTQKNKDILARSKLELMEKVQLSEEKSRFGITDDKITFGDFMEGWLKNVHLIDKKPSTIERYNSTFKTHLQTTRVSLIKLKNLKSSDLQEHYNVLYKNKGSTSIIKSLHKIISPCLRYAYETQRILKDFSKSLKIPIDNNKRLDDKQKINPLTLAEQFTFIDAIKGHPLEALFNTALDTGIRQGELFALRWSDIDFDGFRIAVTRSFRYSKNPVTGHQEPCFSTTKTRCSTRIIPLPGRVAAILLNHKSIQKEKLFKFGIRQNKNTLVFCTDLGTPFSCQNVLKRLKDVYAKVGIENKTFHDLRHTYATRLFELGEQAKTVQTLLGHSNTSVTLNTYTHVLDTLKVTAASKIDDLYQNQKAESEMVWETFGKPLRLVK